MDRTTSQIKKKSPHIWLMQVVSSGVIEIRVRGGGMEYNGLCYLVILFLV